MNSHTRVPCNFSNCRPLHPCHPSRAPLPFLPPILRNTFRDHAVLYIEGYLISVNRFYRRWKYWKHFRLLRDFGRVVFQVDIKLQRLVLFFEIRARDTDRYVYRYHRRRIVQFRGGINSSFILSLNWICANIALSLSLLPFTTLFLCVSRM